MDVQRRVKSRDAARAQCMTGTAPDNGSARGSCIDESA